MTLNMFLVLALMITISSKLLKKSRADPAGLGGQLWTLGGVVNVQVVNSGASYTSDFYWRLNNGPRQALGVNSKQDGATASLGNLNRGDELIFEITVRDTKETFVSGPADRNKDKLAHARVNNVNGAWEVRFEDLLNGGDKNYNDANLVVTGFVDNKKPDAYPAPSEGGQLWATGEEVWVDVLPSSASYTSTFTLVNTKNSFGNSKQVGQSFNLGKIPRDQELVFQITVKETGQSFQNGPADRNGDKIVHARVGQTGPQQYEVRFEDLLNGGDRDFNDANIRVRGGVTHVAPPVKGGRLWSTGGNIKVTILQSSASYTSNISLGGKLIGSNKDTGKVVDLGNIPAGEELVFNILVTNTNDNWSMGGANRNSDGIIHAAVANPERGVYVVGFEDLAKGGDADYDDVRFSVSGAVSHVRPANPADGIGSTLWTTGKDVTIEILQSDAGYTSNINVVRPQPRSVGTNRQAGTKVTMTGLPAGEEFRLQISPNETGKVWVTGPGRLNSDNLPHARVTRNSDGSYTVGFEDLENGGDRDYNDVMVKVTGVEA